jgi:hypothetical protein
LWIGRGDHPLTRSGPFELIERVCAKAGVPHPGVHRFRHTAATRMADLGMPEAELRLLFGWTSPMMAARYTHSTARDGGRSSAPAARVVARRFMVDSFRSSAHNEDGCSRQDTIMTLRQVRIGSLSVSRLIIGGNPFSGNSHRGAQTDREMRHYYTGDRIKATLREAESLGINTLVARADAHICRVLLEYWDEGGTIQWIAQTCPELQSSVLSAVSAIANGAKACYIHGGVMDNLVGRGQVDEALGAIDIIKRAGLPAGVAGHDPAVHKWAEANVDVDFYMCSYYKSFYRDHDAAYSAHADERFRHEDRRTMVETIQTLSRPAIHYKIMAAGRNDPREAFSYAAQVLRPGDAVCVGVYTRERPDMLMENVRLFGECLTAVTP